MPQAAGLGVTKARSAVTIGAFTAVYFVLMWCSGMLGFFGPAFMFVGWIVGLLLNGSVVMLMLVRSRMFGTLTVMGAIIAFLMVVTGHAWVTIPVTLILGFLGGSHRPGWRLRQCPSKHRRIHAVLPVDDRSARSDPLRSRPLLRGRCVPDGPGLRG